MNKYTLIIVCAAALTGCAANQKCGNPAGTATIYDGTKTCKVRIRQALVGTDLNIPKSIKSNNLAGWHLTWVESQLIDGKIQLGHFSLLPPSKESANEKE